MTWEYLWKRMKNVLASQNLDVEDFLPRKEDRK